MTVEEALVALLAAVAGVLLFVGLAQVLGDQPDVVDKRPRPRVDTAPPRRAAARPPASNGTARDEPSRSEGVLTGDD